MSSAVATYSLPYEKIPGFKGSDFQVRRHTHTVLLLDGLESGIIKVIVGFDGSVIERPHSVKHVEAPAFPQNAVEAVHFISHCLLIPQKETLDAVGISERTFFGWKAVGGRLPRKQSLGRVWTTTRVISGLSRANPNLASWYHESEKAQLLFAQGDLNGFILCEAESQTIDFTPEPRAYGLRDDRFFDDLDE